jgi:uncharacterized repeat protein (TIGR03803 family)
MKSHTGTGRSFPRIANTTAAAIQVLAFFTLMFSASAFGVRPAEQVLYSFGSTGSVGLGGLVADKAGNLYGTATGGNQPPYYGLVFELSPPATANGSWTETTLYHFQGGANDGINPFGTLIFDKHGNLYGTTQAGGTNNVGTVFELSPPTTAGGAWTETVLYIFPADGSQGFWPEGNLVMDSAGNLYGTTTQGGAGSAPNCFGGCGTLFEISPPTTAGGPWTGGAIHSFGVTAGDGLQPANNLVMRGDAIYGTTITGGTGSCTDGCGTFFQFVHSDSAWSENILFSFDFTELGSEGAFPFGSVTFDPAGNVYGTTRQGGDECGASIYGTCGTIYELSPPAVSGNPWTLATLYVFTGGQDGGSPYDTLLRDPAGNLYGTANVGGVPSKTTTTYGTVFKLSPPAVSGGAWTETTLHRFLGTAKDDGGSPLTGLIEVNGPLFGTSIVGSDVYAVTP